MYRYSWAVLLVLASPASAQLNNPGATQQSVDSLQTWVNGMTNKLAAVPSVGPGAGQCQESIVPSNIVTSGGVTGQAGTCALIVQCGTSSAYVVKQLNVGSGC